MPIFKTQVLGRRERGLYSGSCQPGKKKDSRPKTNYQDSAWPWKFSKGGSFGGLGGMVRVFLIFHRVQTFFCLAGFEVAEQCSMTLVLSLKPPSSTWIGSLVPIEELKGILLCVFLRGNRDPALLFLNCSSSVSAFAHFSDKQLFESALQNRGKLKETEWSLFLCNKKGETQKGFVPWRAPQCPALFH